MRASSRSIIAACAVFCASPTAHGQTPTAGQNVNMVAGTRWPGGDPFLQRQNEPSIAVSSRNPLHVVAGANDYRTVDLPLNDVLPNAGLAGDAWLGVFKSFDGATTWQSTLLPGYPQDLTPEGRASPLKGYSTASDPVVRPGTNGLFYYAGIAFDRATGKGSVFVARYIDLNNRENGNAAPSSNTQPTTDPIRYAGTTVVARSGTGEFLDKPWIAVDVPRGSAGVCTFQVSQAGASPVTQSFPAGNVYLAYTKFLVDSSGNPTASQLVISRSTDCGQTWSLPFPLVPIDDVAIPSRSVHQGAVVQVDPQSGFVYVAWRRFHDSRKPDSLFIAVSLDRGRTFTPGIPLVSYPASPDPLHPAVPTFFDQGTTSTSFRTNAFPSLAIDDSGVPGWPGRVYVAWSQRMPPYGDAHVMMFDFPGSISLTSSGLALVPSMADSGPLTDDMGTTFLRGNQFMPQLSFVGGKLLAVYYDQRLDHTVGDYAPAMPVAPDALGRFFLENRVYAGELPLSPGLVFGPFISDANPPLSQRRHTIDVVAAEANAGTRPSFNVTRVSRYRIGTRPGSSTIEQLQVNPPALPLFKGGTAANIGDYIDVGGQTFVPNGSSWSFNTAPARAPIRIAAWTTNQDVRPPADGDWTHYTPVGVDTSRTSVLNGATVPDCLVGQAGMRNQNIYSSRITEGLAVFSPQNNKPLSLTVQRAFVVLVQNFTNFAKTFRLRIARQPSAGSASFQQTSSLTTIDASIGPHAGIARPVFAVSSIPTDSITLTVDEVTAPGGSLVPGGLSSSVVLNGDPSAPPLINPDGSPSDIGTTEVYNPDLANPDLANPDLANPDLANPDLANPDLANPDLANPDLANPNVPNPDLANVGVVNPDLANPDLANPDLANFSLSEATYTLTNEGNTTASYRIRLVGSSPSDVKLQLILSKRYLTPVAFNCSLGQQAQNTVQANVIDPPVADPANPDLANPDLANPDLANATLSVAPGDTARVTVRANVNLTRMRDIVSGLTPVAIAHAANTGTTTPQISAPLFITSAALPDGVVGTPYAASLQAFGGTPPYAFGVDGLPAGLTMDANGVISGTPDVATAFPPGPNTPGSAGLLVVFTVRDSAQPRPHLAQRTLNVRIAGPLAIQLGTVPTAVQGTSFNFTPTIAGGIGPYIWSAKGLPDWLTLGADGTLSGTPPASGDFRFALIVSDSGSTPQTASVVVALSVCADATCGRCTQGAPCTTANGCASSSAIDCSTGTSVCVDQTFFRPGTQCGDGAFCNANHACVSCTPQASCDPKLVCHAGQISCGAGDPVCVDAGNLPDGTSCGTDSICVSGTCTFSVQLAVLDDANPDQLSVLEYDSFGTRIGTGAVTPDVAFDPSSGGSRQLVATPDGTRLVVVENGQFRLKVLDSRLNTITTVLDFPFTAADATNSLVFALAADGLRLFDIATGAEVQGSPFKTLVGSDLVVDEAHGAVWTIGNDLRRADLTGANAFQGQLVANYDGTPVSIDVARDGSVWVAERFPFGNQGTIHHYDANGASLLSLFWSGTPNSLRVNQATGDVWVAHSAGLSRIDTSSNPFVVQDAGAFWSLSIDPFNGIVWAASVSDSTLQSYSGDGSRLLDVENGFSTGQKYVAHLAGALPSGLVARLSFEGNLDDTSGNGFGGLVNEGGTQSYTADRHGSAGRALLLDGNTYVSLPSDPAFSLASFTLYAIFSAPPQTDPPFNPLISKGTQNGYGNYAFGILTDTGRGGYVHDISTGNFSQTTSRSALTTGAFFHQAVALDAATLSAYLDGSAVLSVGGVPAPLQNDFPVVLGAHPTYGDPNGFGLTFQGTIDEVLIFNRALSAAEVKQLYDRLR